MTTTCDPNDSTCVVWGDPHIITFDLHTMRRKKHPRQEALFRSRGWKADELSVYDEGTFWLVRSELVLIQGRYVKNKTHGEWTNLGAIAVTGPFLHNNTLIIRPRGVGSVTWNDHPILQTLPSQFANDLVTARYHRDSELVKTGRRGPGVDVELPLGVRLTVNLWRENLAIAIRMHPLAGGQDGQCGNFDGNANDDTLEALIGRAGPVLSVTPSSNLFEPEAAAGNEGLVHPVEITNATRDVGFFSTDRTWLR